MGESEHYVFLQIKRLNTGDVKNNGFGAIGIQIPPVGWGFW